MHCFTESLEVARAAMRLGFLISFSGIVTFKNAKAIKEVARTVPLDRILVERTRRTSRRSRIAARPTSRRSCVMWPKKSPGSRT